MWYNNMILPYRCGFCHIINVHHEVIILLPSVLALPAVVERGALRDGGPAGRVLVPGGDDQVEPLRLDVGHVAEEVVQRQSAAQIDGEGHATAQASAGYRASNLIYIKLKNLI